MSLVEMHLLQHISLSLTQVTIELAYLSSYVNMGKAAVTCVSGCTCEPSTLDGHTTEKHSQVRVFYCSHPRTQILIIRTTVMGHHSIGESGQLMIEFFNLNSSIFSRQLYLHEWTASQHNECEISIKVRVTCLSVWGGR